MRGRSIDVSNHRDRKYTEQVLVGRYQGTDFLGSTEAFQAEFASSDKGNDLRPIVVRRIALYWWLTKAMFSSGNSRRNTLFFFLNGRVHESLLATAVAVKFRTCV